MALLSALLRAASLCNGQWQLTGNSYDHSKYTKGVNLKCMPCIIYLRWYFKGETVEREREHTKERGNKEEKVVWCRSLGKNWEPENRGWI